MACCGKNKKPKTVDKRGNNLDKYAYLNPNQIKLRDAQKAVEPETVVPPSPADETK